MSLCDLFNSFFRILLLKIYSILIYLPILDVKINLLIISSSDQILFLDKQIFIERFTFIIL
jgi:hypothetical protein